MAETHVSAAAMETPPGWGSHLHRSSRRRVSSRRSIRLSPVQAAESGAETSSLGVGRQALLAQLPARGARPSELVQLVRHARGRRRHGPASPAARAVRSYMVRAPSSRTDADVRCSSKRCAETSRPGTSSGARAGGLLGPRRKRKKDGHHVRPSLLVLPVLPRHSDLFQAPRGRYKEVTGGETA